VIICKLKKIHQITIDLLIQQGKHNKHKDKNKIILNNNNKYKNVQLLLINKLSINKQTLLQHKNRKLILVENLQMN